jgi:hypothetical protein
MSQTLTQDETKQRTPSRTLGDYLLEALEISGIKSLEYLTPKNLDGFKPLILKSLKDISFVSKYDVGYKVQDIYFSEGKLRIMGKLGSGYRKYLEGCGPMSLPMHLQDIEHQPKPIDWSNTLSNSPYTTSE